MREEKVGLKYSKPIRKVTGWKIESWKRTVETLVLSSESVLT